MRYPVCPMMYHIGDTVLITVNDILSLIPISRSTLYRWMEGTDFPKPVRLNGRVLWKSEEVHAYINSKQDVQKSGGSGA